MKLGEFETAQVEETQLLGDWYSIIGKQESFPRSSINELLGHQQQGSSRSKEGSTCSALGLELDSGQNLARWFSGPERY